MHAFLLRCRRNIDLRKKIQQGFDIDTLFDDIRKPFFAFGRQRMVPAGEKPQMPFGEELRLDLRSSEAFTIRESQ